jgi:hypothetical protein
MGFNFADNKKVKPMISTERNQDYSIALLLSIPNKNCTGLAEELGISGDTMIRILNEPTETLNQLIAAFSKLTKKRCYLIIDDTLIEKIYSRWIEGTSDNYSTTDRKQKRSLCTVVAMLTDGEVAIPIDHEMWISGEFTHGNKITKSMLAQRLIARIIKVITIYGVLIDGLYTTTTLIGWLIKNNIRFDGRFHCNRVVQCKGETSQVRASKSLKVTGKRPVRMAKIIWQNFQLYVHALWRVNCAGQVSITFYVSNYKAPKKEHIWAYSIRWNIEKFFRTAKQKLGLKDCMVRNLQGQQNHIRHVFFSYTLLQIEKFKRKLKNTETALKSIYSLNFTRLKQRYSPIIQNFFYV